MSLDESNIARKFRKKANAKHKYIGIFLKIRLTKQNKENQKTETNERKKNTFIRKQSETSEPGQTHENWKNYQMRKQQSNRKRSNDILFRKIVSICGVSRWSRAVWFWFWYKEKRQNRDRQAQREQTREKRIE